MLCAPRRTSSSSHECLSDNQEGQGERRMRQIHLLSATLISLAVSFALGACAPTAPASRAQGKAGEISPSWSASAYRSQDRDDAWHFAYAVQSWAGEQSGHVVMIPARHTIVADRAFFSEEFSHVPLRALRGVRADDPNQVVVLKHMWTMVNFYDKRFKLNLTDQDKASLVAFLRTL
jgi:hypothetical protein